MAIANLSFTLDAEITGQVDSLTLDGQPVTLPTVVTPTVDHTYVLVATGPGGTDTASVTVDLPAVVTVEHQVRTVPCGEGFTGERIEERDVTTTDGVPDDPPWVETSNTCVPIPPPVNQYPTWRAGKVVLEWIQMPNSRLTAINNGVPVIDDTYFETMIGLPRPSQQNWQFTWGVNKYGQRDQWIVGWTMGGGHASYSGMWFDDQESRVYADGGDAHWGDNSVHCYDYNRDAPQWVPTVIKPSHKDFLKKPIYGSVPQTYPTPVPGDDARVNKMYDGRRRGGHTYHTQWFLRAMNALACFGSHQYFPTDSGSSSEVELGHLDTGEWDTANPSPIPVVPFHQGDELPWMAKHPLTEDMYFWRGKRVVRWQGGVYTTLLTLTDYDGMRLSGSIDWTHEEILFAGQVGSGPYFYWTMPLTAPFVRTVVTVTGPYASSFRPNRTGGVWWNPDLQCHLYYKDDGFVYSITRSGATEFTVDRLVTTGTGPASGAFANKAGGVLNNFQYDFRQKGMILRPGDNASMWFLVTGN